MRYRCLIYPEDDESREILEQSLKEGNIPHFLRTLMPEYLNYFSFILEEKPI